VLNLRGGSAEHHNSLRGKISTVGTVNVCGSWDLHDGFRDCGHITLYGDSRLDLGSANLDARCLTIVVDSTRRDAYLRCAGLERTTVFELIFDQYALSNPDEQSYLLIDCGDPNGDFLDDMHRLNGGYELELRGSGIYVVLPADDSVSVDLPRVIRYFGLMPLHSCLWTRTPKCPEIATDEADEVPLAEEDSAKEGGAMEIAIVGCGEESENLEEVAVAAEQTPAPDSPVPDSAGTAAAMRSAQKTLAGGAEQKMAGSGKILGQSAGQNGSERSPSTPTDEAACTVAKSLDLARCSFDNRLRDVKGNGNDPFLGLIAAHSNRDIDENLFRRTTHYGIVGGADYSWDLVGDGSVLMRAGAFIGHMRGDSRTRFLGEETGASFRLKQRTNLVGIFGAYESFGKNSLKTNFDATLTFGITANNISDCALSWKFRSRTFAINFEGIRNLCSHNSWQLGPWAGITYHRLYQSSYGDNGRASANLLRTTIGVNVERETPFSCAGHECRLRTYARFGWCCQVAPNSAKGIANNPTPSVSIYGDRHSAVASAGFRQKFNDHWDLSGAWDGDFSGHYSMNKASLTIGYNF
jgi:hypothetical protein